MSKLLAIAAALGFLGATALTPATAAPLAAIDGVTKTDDLSAQKKKATKKKSSKKAAKKKSMKKKSAKKAKKKTSSLIQSADEVSAQKKAKKAKSKKPAKKAKKKTSSVILYRVAA